jgi:hypothetical protein
MTIEAGKLYEVKEVIVKNGGILPMSLSGVYNLIRRGEIDVVRLGKKVFIKGSFLYRLMDDSTVSNVKTR